MLTIAAILAKVFEAPPNETGEADSDANYAELLKEYEPTQEDLGRQGKKIYPNMPLISILMVVTNESEKDLQATIDSINKQSYRLCELCVAVQTDSNINISKFENVEKVHIVSANGTPKEMLQAAEKQMSGSHIMLMYAGDTLMPHAVFEYVKAINNFPIAEVFYCDEDELVNGERKNPKFKPDFAKDTLYSYNYIGRGLLVAKSIHDAAGGLNSATPMEEYDYILRLVPLASRIVHINRPLYTKAKKAPVIEYSDGKTVINANLARNKVSGYTVSGLYNGSFRVHYNFTPKMQVAIVVICDGDMDELKRTLESIEDVTTYKNYKLIIPNNGTADTKLQRYYTALANNKAAEIKQGFTPKSPFAQMCNKCAFGSNSGVAVFMRSGLDIFTPDWIEAMMEFSQQSGVGLIGGKVITPDNRIVHSGMVLGLNGWWNAPYFGEQDSFKNERMNSFVNTIRNTSILGSQCVMVNAKVFTSFGGFDESFQSANTVIDLGIRCARGNLKNIYTPYAKFRYFADIARTYEETVANEEDEERAYDIVRAYLMDGDPMYNPNYDYSNSKPTVTKRLFPAILLNEKYNKK
ncbi:MAG: hypothetical protein GX802_00300 [Clostridiales bacterium]|nr:hypothetical protein [Clostridiales bacterium]